MGFVYLIGGFVLGVATAGAMTLLAKWHVGDKV